MKNKVKYKSIRDVLRKGHIYINGVVTLIMILIWLLAMFLAFQIVPEQYSTAAIFIGLLSGFVAGWFYWSLTIPKWRIWAFNNVNMREWRELKNQAIYERLIWPDNSIFNKTEFRTRRQISQIEQIEKEIPDKTEILGIDEIQNDESLPDKTEYFYAKSELILNPILLIILISIGIFLYKINKEIFGVISLIAGVYSFNFRLFKNLFKRKVQMIISNEGIEMNLKDFGFINWSNTNNIVLDEENGVLTLDAIKDDELYNLTFNTGNFKMKDRDDMLRRINIYLKRYKLKTEANKRR